MAKQPTSTDKLMAAIDASRKASIITPKAMPNAPKSVKSFALDISGSKCMSDARWSPNGGGTLAVTFAKDGSQYLYFGVDRATAKGITDGEALNAEIIGSYDYE